MKKTPKKSTWKTLAKLWPYMWPDKRYDLKLRIAYAAIFLILGKAATAIVPFFFKFATDALDGQAIQNQWIPTALATPVILVVGFNVARVIMTAFNQLRDAIFARVGQHAVRQLAWITFVHMHNLSLRFHLTRKTGGLSRIIERGTKGIEAIVRFTILNTLPTVLEFAMYAIIFAWLFGIEYVIVVALTVWIYSWFTIWATDWRITIRKQMNDSDTDANSKAIDSLLNFETVKYFGNEDKEVERFDVSMEKYEAAATKTWTSLGWLNFGQWIIFSIGTMICMIMSAIAVQNSQQTIGDFVLVNMLLIQLALPLNFIGFVYREIRQGFTDVENMFELLDVESEIKDDKNAKKLKVKNAEIKFENVSFQYENNRTILKDISFIVPAGKTIAFVGPSGAGKSTLSRLLFRFYDVQKGKITIDGQNIKEVKQKSLRNAIGMVPQDTVLFNDSIKYNIQYGRINANEQEIKNAAKLAQIDQFIENLPDGYNTQVGERGLKLSGGEKQRVAIARTLLKAPPVLILDEATSALDTQTEMEIKSALDIVSKNRTTLVIAHRLSTIVDADEIIVLEKGKIVERGTHTKLLKQNGLYAAMWDRQREANEAEERLRAAHENDKFGIVKPRQIINR